MSAAILSLVASLFYMSATSVYFAYFVTNFINTHVIQYLDLYYYLNMLVTATPTPRPFSGHGCSAPEVRHRGLFTA